MSDRDKRDDELVADRRVRPIGKGPRERRIQPPKPRVPERRRDLDPWANPREK